MTEETQQMTSPETKTKSTLWLPAILVVGLVLGALGLYLFQKSRTSPTPAVTENELIYTQNEELSSLLTGPNAIVVRDFSAGENVNIEALVLEAPGYVVIHEDNEGEPGSVIGHSDLLPPGENYDIGVPLSRTSVDGEILYAMIHLDNEDEVYEFPGDDLPALDSEGNPVMSSFEVGSGFEVEEEGASGEEEDQEVSM